MSMRSYYYHMHGVELRGEPSAERIVKFVENHGKALGIDDYDVEILEGDPHGFAEEYESDEGEAGYHAMLATAINNEVKNERRFYVEAMRDYDQPEMFLGVLADTSFPWDERKVTCDREEVEGTIRRYVEELYGSCPEFNYYEIEQYG